MRCIEEAALPLWGMKGAECRLIAARENRVYRVDYEGKAYALRLHRQNYRTNAELWSELEWMEAMAKGGLQVPVPIRSKAGEFLHTVDGIQIDMLIWLNGRPVGKTGQVLITPDRPGLFRKIGRETAKLHTVSDEWTIPQGFTRCRWDRNGLLGEAPLWDRFWENPTLPGEDRKLFESVRSRADAQLKEIEDDLDFGLIHADLVRENVLVNGSHIQLIDFDDAGFGFRLFDLATTLIKNMQERDFPELRSALMDGYSSVRSIDATALDLFLLLRALTYVGWIMARMGEDGSKQRNDRFVLQAKSLAERYLVA